MQIFEDGSSEQNLARAKEVYSQYILLNELITLRISFEKILEQASLLPDSTSFSLFLDDPHLKDAIIKVQEEASQLYGIITKLNSDLRMAENSTVTLQSDHIRFSRAPESTDTESFVHQMIAFLEEINDGFLSLEQSSNLAVINQSLGGQINYLLQDKERYARRIHTNIRGIIPIGAYAPYTTDTSGLLPKSQDKGELINEGSSASEYSEEQGVETQKQVSLLEGEEAICVAAKENKQFNIKRIAPELWRGCFCDQDFLALLCNDAIQSGSASNPMAIMEQLKKLHAKKASTRPRLHRSINKDRTIDTKKIHKKLEGFIYPMKRPDYKYLKMIRGNLFK